MNRVLIFTPTYSGKDYCFDEFIANCEKITYKNKRHIIVCNDQTEEYANNIRAKLQGKPFDVFWIGRGGTSREAIARAQNYARAIALRDGYDYVLSLESDIFPLPNVLERLLLWGKDVVTGLYFIGSPDQKILIPCATVFELDKSINIMGTRLLKTYEEIEEFVKPGLKQVAAGGMGCCLMSRYALEQVPFIYEPDMGGHSDIFWFNDVYRKRMYSFVDTEVICRHKYSDWRKVQDR